MSDDITLKAILEGQMAATTELSRLSGVVGGLQAEVKQWKGLRIEAREDHTKCRAEVDRKFSDHAVEHTALDNRIKPIEELHQQQAGQRNGLSLAWRVVIGVLGALVTVLSVLTFFQIGA